jgi:hypothetical protein
MSSNATNTTCADVLANKNYTGVSCTCTKNFTLDKPYNVSRFYFVFILKKKRFLLRVKFIFIMV